MFVNRNISRQEALRNGTLFDDYTQYIPSIQSARMKMIIYPSFDGYLTIHQGVFCGPLVFAPREVIRIAHFKKNAKYSKTIDFSYLKMYSKVLRKKLRSDSGR
jgi:hypothetical protein